MDLKFSNAEPSAEERDSVDRLLGVGEGGWHGGERDELDHRRAHTGREARARRHLVMEALHAVNDRVGWISPGALNYIGKRLSVAPADVYSVATFYALFSTNPRPKRIVHVCTDIACMARGSKEVCANLEKTLGPASASNGWKHSPCLGVCERAPAAMAVEAGDPPHEHVMGPATLDEIVLALNDGPAPLAAEAPPAMAVPQAGQEGLMLLKRVGQVDPESIDDYVAKDGYAGLKRAFEMGPAKVISEVKDSRLMGRGGAAFPAGIKWESTAKQPATPRYLVCNADESEPGTFKDRAILEGDPFALIESMTIAGYGIGAERGYIYLRGEYPYLLPILEKALEEARNRGYLNEKFDIEIRLGAGAYICGEETALFESIEGKRGFPRIKPPFPTTNGLFDAPTVINNVETLCNLPLILQKGAAAYRQIGTDKSPGPKLFCVSGDVPNPGLYEVAFGVTLRELLEMAGSSQEDNIQAVLFGGAAGAFATPAQFDVKLSFEDLRAAGLPLGSGVIMVFDKTRDLRDILKRLGHFFAHESCGKCYPCQLGTQRQREILDRIAAGNIMRDDTERLIDVGWTMTDASLCGLGQTAASAVLSAIKQFPHLFIENQKTNPGE